MTFSLSTKQICEVKALPNGIKDVMLTFFHEPLLRLKFTFGGLRLNPPESNNVRLSPIVSARKSYSSGLRQTVNRPPQSARSHQIPRKSGGVQQTF